MEVVVINRQVTSDALWSIHREGCSDIRKDVIRGYGFIEGTFSSLEAGMNSIIEDEEMKELGYGPESVKVYPCTR